MLRKLYCLFFSCLLFSATVLVAQFPAPSGSGGAAANGGGGSTVVVDGSGVLAVTTDVGPPVAACSAPSSSGLAAYIDTLNLDLWTCVALNTWKKVLSVNDSGPYTITGSTGSAPSTPSSGTVSCYFSSASNTQICLDSAGNAFTSVKADTGAPNNFVTAISPNGIISKARPAVADLSDGTSVTKTVANGTAALGTSSIISGACATLVTVSAPGVASTDTITWTPNGSIKALTGYAPSTSGGLSIAPYPTTNNVNFDVCNWTTGSVTPGAVTLNWRVSR